MTRSCLNYCILQVTVLFLKSYTFALYLSCLLYIFILIFTIVWISVITYLTWLYVPKKAIYPSPRRCMHNILYPIPPSADIGVISPEFLAMVRFQGYPPRSCILIYKHNTCVADNFPNPILSAPAAIQSTHRVYKWYKNENLIVSVTSPPESHLTQEVLTAAGTIAWCSKRLKLSYSSWW